MEPEELTKLKNLRVELFELTQKVPQVSGEISEMLRVAHSERDSLKQECDTRLAELKLEEADMDKKRKVFKDDEVKSKNDKNIVDAQLDIARRDLKQTLKDLSKANQQVFLAEDELERIKKHTLVSNLKLESLLVLVSRIEETKTYLAELEDLKNRAINEIKSLEESSAVRLRTSNDELVRVHKELVQIEKEKEEARYLWENYSRELHKNMTDYAVVKARIEGVWKKTFPELEIPLD